jgi:predicted Zn-dependent protease
LKELLKREPDSAELNFRCGSNLLLMQQPEKAIPFLQGALKNDPGFVPAQAALGQAYVQIAEAEQAIPYLKAAVADDEDGSRHYQLVRACQSTGRTDLARQTLRGCRKVRETAEANRRELEREYLITAP